MATKHIFVFYTKNGASYIFYASRSELRFKRYRYRKKTMQSALNNNNLARKKTNRAEIYWPNRKKNKTEKKTKKGAGLLTFWAEAHGGC